MVAVVAPDMTVICRSRMTESSFRFVWTLASAQAIAVPLAASTAPAASHSSHVNQLFFGIGMVSSLLLLVLFSLLSLIGRGSLLVVDRPLSWRFGVV